jgi:NAD(P)-dependent dehydrogenase (short-subunit alcohol dehydrogenase family)
MTNMQNRVALVTGSAQGIGRAYAEGLAEAGAAVVAADMADTSEVVTAIEAAGGTAIGVSGDVTSQADTKAMVAATIERFGRVDILINNAAFYAGLSLEPFDAVDEADWDRSMAVNVKGPWLMCRAAAPAMREAGYGRIVNISSNVIFMGKPNFLHYVASKGAVWAMTNALSRELAGTGITVNCVAPGYTITPATRNMGDASEVAALEDQIIAAQSVKRLLEADDIVGSVLYLASDDAAMVTGQTIVVDGGVIVG